MRAISPQSLRAKRSNLSSLAHELVAEIASSRFALLAMTQVLDPQPFDYFAPGAIEARTSATTSGGLR